MLKSYPEHFPFLLYPFPRIWQSIADTIMYDILDKITFEKTL